jgi:hypothetical protein
MSGAAVLRQVVLSILFDVPGSRGPPQCRTLGPPPRALPSSSGKLKITNIEILLRARATPPRRAMYNFPIREISNHTVRALSTCHQSKMINQLVSQDVN